MIEQQKTVGQTWNPFAPGFGVMPPYLAGREEEQALGLDLLNRLTNPDIPEHLSRGGALTVYGPRGNGKTVWLTWLERQVEAQGIEAIYMAPKTTPSREALIKAILPDRWWNNLTEFKATIHGVGLSLVRGQVDHVQDALLARCAKSPTLFLIDEAHTMVEDYGGELLNAVQDLLRHNHALLFVAAGTPGLISYLHNINATFAERGRLLPFGRLSAEATQAALVEPLPGWQFEQGALKRLQEESQRYPYFIQLWGEVMWKRCHERQRVGMSDLDACQSEIDKVRTLFYARRYHELEDDLLHPVAVALAKAFAGSETLQTGVINQTIKQALSGQGMDSGLTAIKRVQDALVQGGYLWEVTNEAGTSTLWEPGIPSLMKYALSKGQEVDG